MRFWSLCPSTYPGRLPAAHASSGWCELFAECQQQRCSVTLAVWEAGGTQAAGGCPAHGGLRLGGRDAWLWPEWVSDQEPALSWQRRVADSCPSLESVVALS